MTPRRALRGLPALRLPRTRASTTWRALRGGAPPRPDRGRARGPARGGAAGGRPGRARGRRDRRAWSRRHRRPQGGEPTTRSARAGQRQATHRAAARLQVGEIELVRPTSRTSTPSSAILPRARAAAGDGADESFACAVGRSPLARPASRAAKRRIARARFSGRAEATATHRPRGRRLRRRPDGHGRGRSDPTFEIDVPRVTEIDGFTPGRLRQHALRGGRASRSSVRWLRLRADEGRRATAAGVRGPLPAGADASRRPARRRSPLAASSRLRSSVADDLDRGDSAPGPLAAAGGDGPEPPPIREIKPLSRSTARSPGCGSRARLRWCWRRPPRIACWLRRRRAPGEEAPPAPADPGARGGARGARPPRRRGAGRAMPRCGATTSRCRRSCAPTSRSASDLNATDLTTEEIARRCSGSSPCPTSALSSCARSSTTADLVKFASHRPPERRSTAILGGRASSSRRRGRVEAAPATVETAAREAA